MAEIYPFRGITFNRERTGPVDQVVTQPYDKISPSMLEAYLRKNQYNIARIIASAPEGADLERHFAGVAEEFNTWLNEGVLTRNKKPCLYPYFQTYRVPGSGAEYTRKSFIGLGKLYDYSRGVIKPHEQTHSGPKVDRLTLTRASGCQFGLLFMLYSDREGAVNALLEAAAAQGEPLFRVEDEYGVLHRLWQLEDYSKIQAIQRLMQGKSLYIADGHHRYETALTYWREKAAEGVRVIPEEGIDRALMSFVSIQDRGLSVLPTHRVVFGLENFSLPALLEELKRDFEVLEAGPADVENLQGRLEALAGRGHSFVVAAKGEKRLTGLKLKDTVSPATRIPGALSEVWKSLDVTLLHKLILEKRLGISAHDLEHQVHVSYLRDPAEALRMVLDPGSKFQAVFFLNPTSVEQVVAVADRSECMPQKSTDFYPKMLTGLVINKLNLQ